MRCRPVLFLILCTVLSVPASADNGAGDTDTTPVALSVGSEVHFPRAGVTIRVVSDTDTWDMEWGHSYRKVQIVEDGGEVRLEVVLPIDRAPDFRYTVSAPDGGQPVALLSATFRLYLVDALAAAVSEVIFPLSGDEIIGVDGRSGALVQLSFLENGTRLRGAVIHGGCFVLDISDPTKPIRIAHTENFNVEGAVEVWPCDE